MRFCFYVFRALSHANRAAASRCADRVSDKLTCKFGSHVSVESVQPCTICHALCSPVVCEIRGFVYFVMRFDVAFGRI
jgi:hypothetical protein